MKYEYVPPKPVQFLFNRFRWNTLNNKILLTFDDGPNPDTTKLILDILAEQNIKALFFCVGSNVEKHPQLTAEILEGGHTIGNHTYHHSTITSITRRELTTQIELFNSLLESKFKYPVKYFRPPHGKFFPGTASYLSGFGIRNIMWSLLTYDYQNNLNIVKFAVNNYLKENSIIVLHDSMKSKDIIGEALRFIIDEANRKDLEFGEPFECLS